MDRNKNRKDPDAPDRTGSVETKPFDAQENETLKLGLDALFLEDAAQLQAELRATPLPDAKTIIARARPTEPVDGEQASRRARALLPLRLAPLAAVVLVGLVTLASGQIRELFAYAKKAVPLDPFASPAGESMASAAVADASLSPVLMIVVAVFTLGVLSIQESWSA